VDILEQQFGMAVDEHAILLVMASRDGGLGASIAVMEAIMARARKLVGKATEGTKEYADLLEAIPPRDPAKVRAEAEERLDRIQEYEDSLDPEAPDYSYNMRAVRADRDLEQRVIRIADETEAKNKQEADREREQLIADAKEAIVLIEGALADLSPDDEFERHVWTYYLGHQHRIIERAKREQT